MSWSVVPRCTRPYPEVDRGGGSSMAKPCPARGSGGMLPREILNIYIEIIPFSAL